MADDKWKSGPGPDVELPDTEKDGDYTASRFKVKYAIWTVAAAAVFFIILILWIFSGRAERIRSVPVLEKAWIVSRLEGENIATELPKFVDDGRGVMLYLVAYGLDKTENKHFYYTENPSDEPLRVIIGGKEIPQDQLRTFSFIDTMSMVGWYKIEVSPYFYRDVGRDIPHRLFWTESRKHKMGDRWWTIADVRADLFTDYHFDYVGTMRYTADVMVFHARDPELIFSNIKAEGAKSEIPGALPPGAHRITMLPDRRSGLDRTYRAFFNLFAFEDHPDPAEAGALTEAFLGGSSRSILIGAMRLLGYDVAYDDPAFLEKVADRVMSGVTIDSFSYFRPAGDDEGFILYGEEGVQPGDILVRGGRYLVLSRNGDEMPEPESGALTGDDVVLDAYNALVIETFAKVLERGVEPIEIWRLRPLESAAAGS